MKKPLVDMAKLEIQGYLQETAFINKFIRLWGTQVVNGVEVLNARNYYLLRSWEQFNMPPAYVPKAGESCLPTTKTECDDIIVGRGGLSGTMSDLIYETICKEVVKVDNRLEVVDRRPLPCTRERKLLEYIGFWEQAKAQKTKGLKQMWLYLSPAKLMDFYEDMDKDSTVQAIKRNLDRYLEEKADIQGRVRLKAKIVTSNEFIPGLDGQQFSEEKLNIYRYEQSEILQEEVWITEEVLVNGVPTVVKKLFPVYLKNPDGTYVKDKDGKLTQIGTEHRKQLENVTSYTNVKNTIQNMKDYIWSHNLVVSDSGTPEDMYEELLTRYLLVHGDQSKIRLEFVQKGMIQYTREEQYESRIWGSYTNYTNGVTVNYRGVNSGNGYSYEVTYNVPVYEVTMVVRDYGEVSSVLVDKIKADIFADYYKKMCTDENGYSYECPDQQFGLATMGNAQMAAATHGKVNGFSSYKSVRRIYQEPDDPDNAAFVAGYEPMYWRAGGDSGSGIFGGSARSIYTGPKDWWVLAPGYGHRESDLPWLKVDVLKGTIGGLKRKDRIKLIGAIIDVGWWEKSSGGGGLLSFVVVIIAVVISVVVFRGTDGGALVKAAMALVAFSAVISIGAVVLESTGNYGDAKWLAKLNKTIAPAVQVASIILVFDVVSKWQTAATNFADDAAMASAEAGMVKGGYSGSTWTSQSTLSAMTSTTGGALDYIMINIKDAVGKIISNVSEGSVSQYLPNGVRFAEQAFRLYADNDISKKKKDLEAKQKRLQEQLEALEESKYDDIYKKFASVMMNPLQMQGSSYEFDRPFESVFGSMHTGNSCRTSTLAVMGEGANTYFRNVV